MPRTRTRDLLAVIALAVLASIAFLDVLDGTSSLFVRDLARFTYPTKAAIREIVMSGEFPFWSRYSNGGQPLAANPEHQVLSPLTGLLLLPNFEFAFHFHLILHVFIALAGMYALLRSMKLGIPAALFGAVSFGLGGLVMSYVTQAMFLVVVAWLPVTCLFTRRFLLAPTARDFALASLFFGLQILAGEPTTVLQTGILLGAYALYRGWRDGPGAMSLRMIGMARRIAQVAAITAAAAAVGCAQLVPAIDLLRDSERIRSFSFATVSLWSLPWIRLGEIFHPNLLGHLTGETRQPYWGAPLYPTMYSPFLFSIYPGFFAAVLALAGIGARARGSAFVAILVAFSTTVALGSHTPLLRVLYDAGLAGALRYPEKFVMIAIFALTIFAARVADRILAGDTHLLRIAIRVAATVTGLAILVAAAGFSPQFGLIFENVWHVRGSRLAALAPLAHQGWIVAALRGSIVVIMLASLRSIARPLWLTAAAVLLLADLAPLAREINPRGPSWYYSETPPVVTQLPRDRTRFRVFHHADWDSPDGSAKRYLARASHWTIRNGVFPVVPAQHGIDTVMERDYSRTRLLPTLDFIESVKTVRRSGGLDWWRPLAAMSNVGYRSVWRPFLPEWRRANGAPERHQPVDFVPVGDNPRYYFSDQIVTIRGREDFVRKLTGGRYSNRVAFVGMPAFTPAPGVVHGWRETDNTATLDVESSGVGFIVMSVTPHKYWFVTLDGRPVTPVVTNIGYQGIVVPAGRHRVEMRYRNDLILMAVVVSMVALALLLTALLPRPKHAPAGTGIPAREQAGIPPSPDPS